MEPDGAGTAGEFGRLRYVPALDGLRALAIALVFLFHVPRWFGPGPVMPIVPGGFLGVDVFFLISGFLITSLLLDERVASGTIALRAFWGRRIARLFPLLWCLLAFAALAGALHLEGMDAPTPAGFLAVLFYVGNWFPATLSKSLGRIEYTWSLAVEEQFYLFWPLIVAAIFAGASATRDGIRRRRMVVAVVAAVGAFASGITRAIYWRSAVHWNAHNPYMYAAVGEHRLHAQAMWFFNTGLRADGLLFGAALAATRHLWQPRIARSLAAVFAVLGLALAAYAIITGLTADVSIPTFKLPLLELGVALILVAIIARPRSALTVAFASAPLVWIGRRSYALYLVHVPVIVLIDGYLGNRLGGAARITLEVLVAVILAHLAHIAIELPAQRKLRVLLHAEHAPSDKAPETVG